MGEIISIFHLDIKLILAQLVNFAIVVFVLWYFALKPLSKTMSERTGKIEKSLKDAEQINANLKISEAEKNEIIKTARIEAEKIISDSRLIIDQDKKTATDKAKAEIKNIIESSRKQIEADKKKMYEEIKSDVAELVEQAVLKVLGRAMDKKINSELIDSTIKEIK